MVVTPQADVIAYVLADLVLILVAARALGRAAAALGQPSVVGEIAAGILIGPTLLGGHVATGATAGAGLVDQIYPPESFAFLALIGQIGLVLFMFLVGVELDRRLLRGHRRQIVLVAAVSGVAPIAIGFAAAPLFDGPTWQPTGVGDLTFSLFLAAGFAATALPVLARLLQEKGLMATPVGVTTVGVAGVVTVVAFMLVAAGTASADGGAVLWDVATRLVLAAALIVVLLAVVRPVLGWALGRIDVVQNSGSVLTALLALALTSGLVADRIGINALIGGLLFGLAVPVTGGLGDMVLSKLSAIVGLMFMPVFFAVSGLVTDLRVLSVDALPGLLLFLLLLIAGKWGAAYLAARATGHAGSEANAIGVLLSCGGVLVLVVGLIALQMAVITPQLHSAFVLSALVTLVMAGPLADRFIAGGSGPQIESEHARAIAMVPEQ